MRHCSGIGRCWWLRWLVGFAKQAMVWRAAEGSRFMVGTLEASLHVGLELWRMGCGAMASCPCTVGTVTEGICGS